MNPARQLRRFLLQDTFLIVLLVAGTVAALSVGVPAARVLPGAATLLFFLLLMMGMYLYNTRRIYRHDAAIRAAQPQVAWSYDAAEWRRFLASALFQASLIAQVDVWQPLLLRNAVVFSSLMFLILACGGWGQGLAGFVIPTIISISVFFLFVRSARRVQQSLQHPFGQDDAPPTIVISPVGAILGPQSLVFRQPRATIQSTEIVPGTPATLRIQLAYTMGRRILSYTLFIPIPSGHETEAEMIRQHIPLRPTPGGAGAGT